jgi:hypothetical protein
MEAQVVLLRGRPVIQIHSGLVDFHGMSWYSYAGRGFLQLALAPRRDMAVFEWI